MKVGVTDITISCSKNYDAGQITYKYWSFTMLYYSFLCLYIRYYYFVCRMCYIFLSSWPLLYAFAV
jgi:hypothetical protein